MNAPNQPAARSAAQRFADGRDELRTGDTDQANRAPAQLSARKSTRRKRIKQTIPAYPAWPDPRSLPGAFLHSPLGLLQEVAAQRL
jgi:hypothetical protein